MCLILYMNHGTCRVLNMRILFLAAILTVSVFAEEQRYVDIALGPYRGWKIRMSDGGDLNIYYGASHGVGVLKEVYGYEQFHKDVVGYIDNLPEGAEGGSVSVALSTQSEIESRWSESEALPVASLWNDLMRKLLPVAEAYPPDIKVINEVLEGESPLIPVEGSDEFDHFKVRLWTPEAREERAVRILASLTPEQRVALGNPAGAPTVDREREAKHSAANEGNHARDNPLARGSEKQEAGVRAEDASDERWLIWSAIIVAGVLLVCTLVVVSMRRRS